MGKFSELHFLEQEARLNNDYSELDKFWREQKWKENYDKKIYDKLDEKLIEVILKSKIVIGQSYYQKLKTNKVLLEIFIVLKILGKKGIKTSDLIAFGFKKTSIKNAIKKLLNLGILDLKIYKEFRLLKLRKIVLKKPKESFWILKKKDTWKIFLLYGLDAAIMYVINSFKSKVYKWDKKLHSVPNRRKVILQNAYYKNLNISNTKIYLLNKMICNYFLVRYREMFGIIHKRKTKFITVKSKKEKLIHKFIGYEFKTLRYLLMQI
ncbi:MAGa4850 family ICE element protein [Metamycoplasma equirhinis]|uniref:MAGa4850 family ICE element protein n=1 Tax=Metamycoplasma equirhinis TaxID=92402 RepID=UPI0035935952